MKSICWSKFLRVLSLIAGLSVLCAGCVKSKVLVKVNPDGAGNIIVTRLYGAEVISMVDKQMEQQKKQIEMMGGMEGINKDELLAKLEDPLCNEEMVKYDAESYGDGVEFVQMKKINKGDSRGYIAVYSFKNVNDVKINLGGVFIGNAAVRGGEEESVSFDIAAADGKPSVLKVKLPIRKPDSAKLAAAEAVPVADEGSSAELEQSKQMFMAMGNPFGFTGAETEAELIRKITKDIELNIAVEVNGTISKSNASLTSEESKNRFTVLDVNFGKLCADDKVVNAMKSGNSNTSLSEMLSSNMDKPGIVCDKNSEITVEFQK